MQHASRRFICLVVLILSSSIACAQTVGKPEDQVRWRQGAYATLGWSMTRIKANVDGAFNKEQVMQAANVIQAIANSGMKQLYGAGTETANGFHPTHAKSALFKDGDKVGELAKDFVQQANEMAKIAVAGEAAAVKTQFGALGKSCKNCHDKYREKD